jgi:hypothetical protein
MPSLLGTYVAANYGRMTSQDTYGGTTYSNFGTRNLGFFKVTLSGGTPPDFTTGAGPTGVYTVANNATDSLDYFAVAIRTIQQYGEIYFVGTPTAQNFVFAMALDTANDAAANSNVEVFNTAYPTLGGTASGTPAFAKMAADLLVALGSWGSGAVAVAQLTASGATIA